MLNQEIVRHRGRDIWGKPYLCSTVKPFARLLSSCGKKKNLARRTPRPAILPPPYAEGFFLWVAMSPGPLIEPGTNHPESNCTWDD